jgi:hypothetical protein
MNIPESCIAFAEGGIFLWVSPRRAKACVGQFRRYRVTAGYELRRSMVFDESNQCRHADRVIMNGWFFRISPTEIDDAARDLLARHGEGARDEAVRLADVGRRIGSRRNSEIFRLAAQRLSGRDDPAVHATENGSWLTRIKTGIAEFGAPLTPLP